VKKQSGATTALAKVIQSGNFASIKKAMLASFNGEANTEKAFTAFLKGASSRVKAAAAVSLKLANSFKSIIEKSTSMTQFESSITAAEETPKVMAALKLLDGYTTGLCGSIIPTN
jgi:hypothetical protein